MTRSRDWCCAPSSCANADPLAANWSSRHISPFTRRISVRGLTMHVSRSPVRLRDIGRGTKPCHVSNDCLAAADKARLRAPFGGFSRATPVLLRPGAWASRGKNPSGQRHVRSPARVPETAGIADPGLPPDLQRHTGAPGLFSAGGGPFSARALWQGFVVSQPLAPVPPRRIAMRCSQGGTGVILAQVGRAGKNEGRRLNLIGNRRALIAPLLNPSPTSAKGSRSSPGLRILSHKGER